MATEADDGGAFPPPSDTPGRGGPPDGDSVCLRRRDAGGQSHAEPFAPCSVTLGAAPLCGLSRLYSRPAGRGALSPLPPNPQRVWSVELTVTHLHARLRSSVPKR